jgi:decaprenylphospho-beta-D-ribofuranose 2-oxidase
VTPAEAAPPTETASSQKLLTGWGRTAATLARLTTPTSEDDARKAVHQAHRRGVIARGLARSYGDAAQNAGGDVIDTTSLDRLLALDLERGLARVQAGVTLDWLMHTLVPLGWWPTVTPGTRQVTVGGAIGSDIHGKGHHRDGTFGANVESLVLETPGRGTLTVTPADDPEVFWATTGGMGLTGVVLEATIRLLPVETSMMRVDSERCGDLDTLMARMADTEADYHYSVAWIDCLARGRSLGRSVLELGEHARRDELPAGQRTASRALTFAPFDRAVAPSWFPPGLLNRWTVAAFNEVWYRKSPVKAEGHLVPAASYFHPLDLVQGWNRIYGRPGFLQYQAVLPDGAERALRTMVEALSASHCASFLAVLKRFGDSNPGPLSFPRPGWTLALDVPSGVPGLRVLFDRLDDLVVESGGRVYLAKDSRLRPDLLEAMYPDIGRWRTVRDRLDPDRQLQSDLARRLGLLG